MAKHSLVIVESPAKAKTLARMLGKSYVIKASLGHIRDLPKSRIGVDIEHDFEPKYVVSRDKSKTVKELKEAVKDASTVYLATDPDREGEAIAWHLAEATRVDKTSFRRVVFHEITSDAIGEAFKHPRDIDMHLVDAQQARRIVDRLVGYKLSPLLWRKVRRGLSAGRVQSVAVKIVVDREREIEKFVPVEYWTIAAELLKQGTAKPQFRATLVGLADGKKLPVSDKKTAEAVKGELEKAEYSVFKIATRQAKRSPAPPFITSTLQQEAWRRFHFSAKKTMALAQQLYEGIPVGDEGSVGLITYMRTDSTHVAQQAIAEAREFIGGKYGAEYLPAKPRFFAGKVKGAQEAHEAIRPTRIMRQPQSIKSYLSLDQNKLYQLIWQRMVASQMAEAVFDNTTLDVEAKSKAARTNYLLRTQTSVNVFPGFITLYAEQKDEEDEEEKKVSALPRLEKGDALKLMGLEAEQNFTKPPPRFTEATLIKMLEQNGIGRPSTYAPILATIQDREYVSKTAGAFQPTELGFVVTDMLVENFGNIINVEYTAQMEDKLDKIAGDEVDWVSVVRDFYTPLEKDLEKASEGIEKVTLTDEPTGETCPDCGKPLVIKTGRFGKFIACSSYPDCKYHTNFRIKTGVPCPDCPEHGELVGRFNKKGKIFYGCNAYPKHKFAINAKPVKEPCPECGKLLIEAGAKSVRCTSCKYRGKQAELNAPVVADLSSAPAANTIPHSRFVKKWSMNEGEVATEPSSDPTPNTFLNNRFEMIRSLGQGGMGEIFEAIDHKTNSPCIIKTPRFGTQTPKSDTQQFVEYQKRVDKLKNEAEFLRKYKHPNIVKFIDYFTDGSEDYLVEDRVDGKDLSITFKHSTASQSDVIEWGRQILSVLEFIHQKRYLHRDLTPSNIMLRPDNNVTVIDFGTIEPMDTQTTDGNQKTDISVSRIPASEETVFVGSGIVKGTFTAPEQNELSAHHHKSSDLYAVGATLFYLLTSRSPFPGANSGPLSEEYLMGKKVNSKLARCIAKSLNNDPKKRFDSTKAMKEALSDE